MNWNLREQPRQANAFVARSPILDRNRRIFGYSLRVRATQPVSAPSGTEGLLGRLLAESVQTVGLDTLVGGRRAFMQVDRETLLNGLPPTLYSDRTVVELPGSIDADADVVAACQDLRRAGYSVAIDDFVLSDRTADFVPLATYLKIDASAPSAPEMRARIVACLAPGGAALIAKNVETLDKFEESLRDGFTYFQGFFFGRPMLAPRRNGSGAQIAHLRLLRALQNPDLSVRQLEELVKHDTALCYRILRTVNSAAFALQTTVHSILEALILLGTDSVRRWASLWVIAGLSEDAHSELVVMSAVRARCCEILAGTIGGEDAAGEGFLLGMCSLLDAILGRSMSEVLIDLPIGPETQAALRGQDNWKRRVLDCVIAYERGDWDKAIELASRTAIERTLLPVAHAEALRWSRQLQEI
jgi:EAL and modified HD-GYP domain-containing signal transduction protein